jgi:hypothetical protein
MVMFAGMFCVLAAYLADWFPFALYAFLVPSAEQK